MASNRSDDQSFKEEEKRKNAQEKQGPQEKGGESSGVTDFDDMSDDNVQGPRVGAPTGGMLDDEEEDM